MNGGGKQKHTILTKGNKEINIFGILNPRVCMIRRTKLLRLGNTGKIVGIWMEGDGEYRDEKGKKQYTNCVRRYFVLFLD